MSNESVSEKKLRKLNWKEIWIVVKTTFQEFFQHNSFQHGAALAYYTIFALVPILYLSLVTFGRVVGNEVMKEIIAKLLHEHIGIKDVNGIMDFLKDVDLEKGSFVLNVVGVVALLISSTALLASLKNSINTFFNVERTFDNRSKQIINNLVSRLISISMLGIIGLVVIVIYFAQTVLISFGNNIFDGMPEFTWLLGNFTRQGLSILSNVIIFTLLFKFLHDGVLRWKLAIAGSLVTSILLYLGQLLIKYYLGNFFFAADGGVAGTLLIILLWMYYTSQIIFLGAKFTAVYAKMVGFPILTKQ
jgi:membrane protein